MRTKPSRVTWKGVGKPNDDLVRMMKIAARALACEDAALHDLIEKGHDRRFAIAPGLSYWLYETTVVYIIWKSWLERRYHVRWDWTAGEHRGGRGKPPGHGGTRIDLVEVGAKGGFKAAFEAKWWNREQAGIQDCIEDDIWRLRANLCRGFLLTFWWDDLATFNAGYSSAESDLRDAGAPVVGYASFKTMLAGAIEGRFVFCVSEVRANASRRGHRS